MEIYLMQHGLALSKKEDSQRPLSSEGRAQIERSASALSEMGIHFDLIIASTKKRSRGTAEIVAEATGYKGTIEETGAIKPSADPREAIAYLGKFEGSRSVFLAGHLPSLARIASRLLSEKSEISIQFTNGGLCRVDVESVPGPSGTLCYCLTPGQLALMSR